MSLKMKIELIRGQLLGDTRLADHRRRQGFGLNSVKAQEMSCWLQTHLFLFFILGCNANLWLSITFSKKLTRFASFFCNFGGGSEAPSFAAGCSSACPSLSAESLCKSCIYLSFYPVSTSRFMSLDCQHTSIYDGYRDRAGSAIECYIAGPSSPRFLPDLLSSALACGVHCFRSSFSPAPIWITGNVS